MNAFRTVLAAAFLAIAGHTLVVLANHGLHPLPVFFGDMTRMQWPGQFNLDFMCLLLLAGLWANWRHQFSVAGVVLGLVAVFGGLAVRIPAQAADDESAILWRREVTTGSHAAEFCRMTPPQGDI
jgi:hypothetical protein